MIIDQKRFLALNQPGVSCDLHLVHSLLFDELDLNHEIISILKKGRPSKEENPYLHADVERRIQELLWANEGLRSLMNKVFNRIDEHLAQSKADTIRKESSSASSLPKEKQSVEEVLCSEAGLRQEENTPSFGQDGGEGIDPARKNNRAVLDMAGHNKDPF